MLSAPWVHLAMAQRARVANWSTGRGVKGQKITSSDRLLDLDFRRGRCMLHHTKDTPFAQSSVQEIVIISLLLTIT